MLNANQRFEIIASLYYDRYLDLAPGKDPGTAGRSISHDENTKRFGDWVASGRAFEDAIEKIGRLENEIEHVTYMEHDDAGTDGETTPDC